MFTLIALVLAADVDASHASQLELSVTPATATVSTAATHLGSSVGVAWLPHPRVAVTVRGSWNWVNQPDAASDALTLATRVDLPSALLLVGSVGAGTEIVMGSGEVGGASVALFVPASLSAGFMRVRLQPGLGGGPQTWGDAGARLVASVGLGVKLRWRRLVARLEVGDVLWDGGVSTIDGCTRTDVTNLMRRFQLIDGAPSPVGAGCRESALIDPGLKQLSAANAAFATSPGGVAHHLQAALSVGVAF